MKKFFAICFIAGALTLTACTNSASDFDPTTGEVTQDTPVKTETPAGTDQNLKSDFEIEEIDGGLIIKKYNGSSINVQIPEAIDGKPVTGIDTSAFRECTDITSVSLPDSITAIGSLNLYKNEKIQVTYKRTTYLYDEIENLFDSINC